MPRSLESRCSASARTSSADPRASAPSTSAGVRDPQLQPLQFGGGHERGLRSGTLALHQLVGFGACLRTRGCWRSRKCRARLRSLRERLWQGLQPAAPLWRNGAVEPSAPGILNVGFAGIEGESLLLELDGALPPSSGAACSSATGEPSYVLRALGRSDEAIQASLRLSLGRGTTTADVDRAAAMLVRAVARLRAVLPAGALETDRMSPAASRYSATVRALFRSLPAPETLRPVAACS